MTRPIKNQDLTPAAIPAPGHWNAIREFAHTFDGYELVEDCGDLSNRLEGKFQLHGTLAPGLTLDELRAALFFVHRAERHSGTDITEDPVLMLFVETLVDEIWLVVKNGSKR